MSSSISVIWGRPGTAIASWCRCWVNPSPAGTPRGRIVRVLERGREVLPVKVFKKMGDDWLCRPSDPRLGFGIIASLKDPSLDLKSGDIALCVPGEKMDPTMWEGEITEVLGSEADVEVQEALVKSNHSIRVRFPSGSVNQAEALPPEPVDKDFQGRRDLTEMQFVTIDGATARDFDDAILVERSGAGYKLWVAIADVAHYVGEGSPLDKEALERGNSYYFPKSVVPMFPERLSNGPVFPQSRREAVDHGGVHGYGRVRCHSICIVFFRQSSKATPA